MLDDRTVDRKGLDNPGHRLWNQSSNKYGWSAYLGGADPSVAVPARREDLSGLPPAWLGVGTFDLFHDEDLAYAERLKAAGVPCEVEVVQGAFHGFDGILPKAEVSQSFFNSQCALLRRTFEPAAA
jgi:acetyl esterase/lipase